MKKSLFYLASVVLFVIIWQLGAALIASPVILPSFTHVIGRLFALCLEFSFWHAVSATFFRVLLSFFITFFFGIFIGLLAGRYPIFKAFIAFPLALIRCVPVVALILIAVFVFRSSFVPIFASILMSLPVMITSVASGFILSPDDKKLLEMSEVYSFTKIQKIRYIFFPKLKQYVVSGAISSFGMTWKVVAAGEVLSLPPKSMGTLLQAAQVHLESADLYAIALAIVILSFSLESLLKLLLKARKNERYTD